MKRNIIAQRVREIPPWPIMGYDLPRILRGIVVTKLAEIKLFGFIITIKRRRWEERKIGGA